MIFSYAHFSAILSISKINNFSIKNIEHSNLLTTSNISKIHNLSIENIENSNSLESTTVNETIHNLSIENIEHNNNSHIKDCNDHHKLIIF